MGLLLFAAVEYPSIAALLIATKHDAAVWKERYLVAKPSEYGFFYTLYHAHIIKERGPERKAPAPLPTQATVSTVMSSR